MKIKILTLTESERCELTSGFRNGESHCFRMRCRCVLLKSEGLSSAQVGDQTEMTAQSVNGWVKRFETNGIKGLHTRPGQGRKPIMGCSGEAANFFFYIPPYSPHLNIVETLWRIMKGKWIRSQDYTSADALFYTTNRALAEVGKGLRINYAHTAA